MKVTSPNNKADQSQFKLHLLMVKNPGNWSRIQKKIRTGTKI